MLKLIVHKVIGLIIISLVVSCNNYQELFLKDSNNWEASGDAKWKFSDTDLIGEVIDGEGFVITKQKYDNFILELQFNPDSTINSGVFIRCDKQEINPTQCYELNIWDMHPDQDNRTGAIVTRQAPLVLIETINKWNTYRIKAEKNHIQAWINGTLTAEMKDAALFNGYIGLQAWGTGKIRFRNVNIISLDID